MTEDIVSVEDRINEILEELGYKSKGAGDEDNGERVNLTLVLIALNELEARRAQVVREANKKMKYKSKPVVIEAHRFLCQPIKTDWLEAAFENGDIEMGPDLTAIILSNEHGRLVVRQGDWIIKGTEGELYPCTDSVFRRKYEACEE